MNSNLESVLQQQKQFFASGETRSLTYRLSALESLRKVMQELEPEILEALRLDLRKSEFEAYASEIGLIYKEIRLTIKQLPQWMKPRKVATPLVLWPSQSYIYPQPLGQVLIIAPWNYPLQLALSPLVGAIAAGNCSIVKPSELAPHTSAILAKIIARAFDPAFCATVHGGVPETQELLSHKFSHIFFTGSTQVGRVIMQAAAKHLTPVTLELGGKSPCLVDQDVDLDITARKIVWGKFYNAGQTCIAPDYLLVHRSMKPALLEKIRFYISRFYGENPQTSSDYGRIINRKNFDRLVTMLDEGTIVAGGQRDPDDLYLAPTVVDDVTLASPVMAEEIFGPILPVLTYDSLDEAIRFINERPNPLALYLFTRSRDVENKVRASVAFGGGCVNNILVHLVNPDLPFGGVGESGVGRYHGKTSFDVFTHLQSVVKSPFCFESALAYPLYTKAKVKLGRRLIR